MVDSVRSHPDFTEKYQENADPYNRNLALEKMLQDVMLKRRKEELELYKLFASDPSFKAAWSRSVQESLDRGSNARLGAG